MYSFYTMASVTISAEDLQSVYSQLNFLRNYVGVCPLDWQEYVVGKAAAPASVAPVAPVAPVVPVAPVAPVAPVPVETPMPDVVGSTPVKKSYF